MTEKSVKETLCIFILIDVCNILNFSNATYFFRKKNEDY